VSGPFTIGSAAGHAWCRFTISEQPLGPDPWNGAGTFGDGETEDYLLLVNASTSVPEVAGSSAQEITVNVNPNPASRGAQIDLHLARDARVLVTVHDVTGRLVRTVIQHALARGVHNVAWDGADDRGEAVSSGIYFVRGEADGRSAVQKLVVTK
jgi:flagellar hook assembly protein FlgD